MKKTTLLALNLVWLLIITPHPKAQAIYVSPQCQEFFNNPNASLQNPNTVTCLITAYTKDFPPAYIGKKDIIPPPPKIKIVSSDIPEGQSCTRTKPCPVGHVTFSNGKKVAVSGTCHFLSKNSSAGSCSYSEQKTVEYTIKGIDFAEISTPSNIVSNIQNPSILLNTQFKKLLSTEDQIRKGLQLLGRNGYFQTS